MFECNFRLKNKELESLDELGNFDTQPNDQSNSSNFMSESSNLLTQKKLLTGHRQA